MSHTASRFVPPPISAGMLSLGIHGVVLLLLLLAAAVVVPQPPPLSPHKPVTVALHLRAPAPAVEQEDPGGGANDPLPARQGRLPTAPPRIFIRPMLAVNDHPMLPVEIGMTDLPDLNVDLPSIGDPYSLTKMGGLGPGPGTGIGPGSGPGVGPGSKSGFGSVAPSTTKVTRGPQLIYKEEPQYSEPARRAHVQGFVRLRIDVGLDGRAVNIRVIQGIGLGLDESAIEAVKHWRFQPAMAGNEPVVAPATIEVGFHLI